VSRRLLAAVAVAAALTAVYGLAFPDRPDYAGHLVAGAGGTLLLLALVLPVRLGGPWRAVAVAAVAVLAGVGTEATVFRLAEFDPVDLANQSLGGLLVSARALDAGGPRDALAAAGCAVVLLVVGFRLAFA
jgi:hypothetical protein